MKAGENKGRGNIGLGGCRSRRKYRKREGWRLGRIKETGAIEARGI